MRRAGRFVPLVVTWSLSWLASCTQPNPVFGLQVRSSDAGTDDASGMGGGDSGLDSAPPAPDLAGGALDGSAKDSGAQTDVAAAMDASGTVTLLAYWSFEDGSGSSFVADRSGSGNHGFLEGLSPTGAWVTGHSGTGLEFPPEVAGAESGVRVPLTSRLDALRTFTLVAWMKRQIKNSPGLWTVISRQRANTSDEIFSLTTSQAYVEAYVPATGTNPSGAREQVPNLDGRWVHVAATYDGQALRTYADGAQIASANWPNRLQSSTTPIFIGTNKNAGRSEPFEGVIDDVALFEGALPASDIRAIFQGASPLSYR